MFRWIGTFAVLIALGSAFIRPAQAQTTEPRRLEVNFKLPRALLSPNGALLAVYEDAFINENKAPNTPPTIAFYTLADLKPAGEALSSFTDYVSNAVFSPDGRTLATLHRNGDLLLWDVASRKLRQSYYVPSFFGGDAEYTADGRTLIVAAGDPTNFLFFDVSTGAITHILAARFKTYAEIADTLGDVYKRGSYQYPVFIVTKDGKQIVTANANGGVEVWDIATGARTTIHKEQETDRLYFNIRQLVATPDGNSIIYYDNVDRKLYQADIKTKTEKAIGSSGGDVFALFPDGKRIAWLAATPDKKSQLRLAALDTLDNPQDVFVFPRPIIFRRTAATLTPDGRQLVVSGFLADGGDKGVVYVFTI